MELLFITYICGQSFSFGEKLLNTLQDYFNLKSVFLMTSLH